MDDLLKRAAKRSSYLPDVGVERHYPGYCPFCKNPPNIIAWIRPKRVTVQDGQFKKDSYMIHEVCLDCGSVIRTFYDKEFIADIRELVEEAGEYNTYMDLQKEVPDDLDIGSAGPEV